VLVGGLVVLDEDLQRGAVPRQPGALVGEHVDLDLEVVEDGLDVAVLFGCGERAAGLLQIGGDAADREVDAEGSVLPVEDPQVGSGVGREVASDLCRRAGGRRQLTVGRPPVDDPSMCRSG
jgi:hypothetical protein